MHFFCSQLRSQPRRNLLGAQRQGCTPVSLPTLAVDDAEEKAGTVDDDAAVDVRRHGRAANGSHSTQIRVLVLACLCFECQAFDYYDPCLN